MGTMKKKIGCKASYTLFKMLLKIKLSSVVVLLWGD